MSAPAYHDPHYHNRLRNSLVPPQKSLRLILVSKTLKYDAYPLPLRNLTSAWVNDILGRMVEARGGLSASRID